MIKTAFAYFIRACSSLSHRGMLYLLLMLSFCPTIDSLQAFEAKPRVDKFIEELSNNKYQPQRFDGDLEPKQIPDLKKDKETLLGIDLDNDKVRDDLEIFINRNFSDDYERITLKNFVKKSRDFFLLDPKKDSKEKMINVNLALDESDECFTYLVQSGYVDVNRLNNTSEIDAYVFNTPKRKAKMREIYLILMGGGSEVSNTEEAFERCPEPLKKKYPFKKRDKK